MNPAESYARKVLKGEILAGRLVKLSCERFLNDLKRKDIYLDLDTCERVVNFFEKVLVHSKEPMAGKPFILALWQKFFLYNIYGWKYTETGLRRIRSFYLQIARKNAKSELAAGIALYDLFLDNDKTPEILIGANSEKQAKICTTLCGEMIRLSPSLSKRLGKVNVYTHMGKVLGITYREFDRTGAIQAMSKYADSQDGFNPSRYIIDEYHERDDDSIKNVAKSGQVARLNPSGGIITTAGFNRYVPCYEKERVPSIKMLEGIVENDSQFSLIYERDQDDDLDSEDIEELEMIWAKTNPLAYHEKYNNDPICNSRLIPNIKEEYKDAKIKGGTAWTGYLTKNCNEWTDAAEFWIRSDTWKKNIHGIKEEELKGVECYGGVDLARTRDLNAFALFFPNVRENIHALKVWFWIPKPKLLVTDGGVDYRKWVEQKFITVIDTDAIDPADVGHEIVQISNNYNVQSIAFDPKYADMGASQAVTLAGYEATSYAQGIMNMSPPTKEFEMLVTKGQIDHFNNPVLAWNMNNVVLFEDKNENIAPHKGKSVNRIDGAVASIISIGEWMTNRNKEEAGPMIYSYED